MHKRKRTPTYKRSHNDNDSSDADTDETYYQPTETLKRKQTHRVHGSYDETVDGSPLWTTSSANVSEDKFRTFRASRAVCLTVPPSSFVTIFINRWLPPNTGSFSSENGDHLWVPHSVPQVKQEKFKCVKVTGPAAAHVRLLEEKPEEGILKFSIQGELTHNDRRGQIRTFSGYYIRITARTRGTDTFIGKELFVMTKTNHVAAGPQVINVLPSDEYEPPSDQKEELNESMNEEPEEEEEEEAQEE